MKEYRLKHPEKYKKLNGQRKPYSKAYYEKNKEKLLECNRKWHQEHKQQVALRKRKTYWRNRTLESYLQRKQKN